MDVELVKEILGKLAWWLAGVVTIAAWDNRMRWANAFLCAAPFRFASIRITASSLVRIELDGRYLLVRGNRIRHQFQPVGGVYKYFAHAKGQLDAWGVTSDKNLPIDDDSKEDLRVRVPGKNVPAFLRWFDRARERESNPWREFHEELVRTGFLDGAKFPHAHFRYVKRKEDLLHWSQHFQTLEIRVFDVFELILTQDQEPELRRLTEARNTEYAWVSEDRIRRLGFQPGEQSDGTTIAPTAMLTL